MQADKLDKTLKQWQLGLIFSLVLTATAGLGMSQIIEAPAAAILAIAGLAVPFVLRSFLNRAAAGVGAHERISFVTAFAAIIFGFVMIPVMMWRGGRIVGDTTGDVRIKNRSAVFIFGFLFATFVAPMIMMLISAVLGRYEIGMVASNMFLAVNYAAYAQGLRTHVVEHVDMQQRNRVRQGDATGHAAPVAVRS